MCSPARAPEPLHRESVEGAGPARFSATSSLPSQTLRVAAMKVSSPCTYRIAAAKGQIR
jgi:hypothetical protein